MAVSTEPADNPSDELYIPTYFARQPVFCEGPTVWGYELLYRDRGDATAATFTDSDAATLQVAASAFIHPEIGRTQPKKLIVNFTPKSILDQVPYALPAEDTVVKFSPPEKKSPELETALQRLRDDGYVLALDCFEATPSLYSLYRLADVLIVDILGKSSSHIQALLQRAPRDAQLLAKRVQSMESYRLAKDLGFLLFQGYFFKRPEMMPGRKINSNQASRLSLFRLIERSDPDFDGLADTVRTDVSLSYRLLTYLNSAAFSFPEKIRSIKQAVVILGWRKVRNWLRLIILTDLLPSSKPSELPYLSAVRGKFLEQVALKHDQGGQSSSLFLLGLFSLLDSMLDLPMKEVLSCIPLEDDLRDALDGKSNHYSPWLEISVSFETGNWDNLDILLRKLKLDPLLVARCYYDSLLWANSFFGNV